MLRAVLHKLYHLESIPRRNHNKKRDLQKQANILIGRLSNEKLIQAVDYLTCLQEQEQQNALKNEKVPQYGLGTAIHEIFKPFGGVELNIPPRESIRELPRFDKIV